jgi:uncharacterized protein
VRAFSLVLSVYSRQQLAACLDSNVFISGIGFQGIPLRLIERALRREFHLITSVIILEEVRRNLVGKLDVDPSKVDPLLEAILSVSSAFVPSGKYRYIEHEADNLVLEVALMGGADVLVTGDKRHLLPLNPFIGMILEPPSKFLARLDNLITE